MRSALLVLLAALLLGPVALARGDGALLVGTWVGTGAENQGERVELRADGTGTLAGAAVEWKVWGKDRLRVTIPGSETLRCTYVLAEPELRVTLQGVTYPYRREGPSPQVEAAPTEESEARGYVVPKALEGVGTGKVQPYTHPKNYFTCALPEGWSVANETPEALVVNPGLAQGDTLDALVFLTWGQLEEGDRGKRPTALVDRDEAEFRAGMREQGLVLDRAQAKSRAVLVGDVPGAVQEWTGKASSGQAIRVWLGGVLKRDTYLSVAVVLVDAKAERFLPGVKQLFASLKPTPPERNPALERALAGHTMSRSQSGSSGFFGSVYELRADGSVKKELLASGGVGGMDYVGASTEEWGRWEVVGDLLYLYFRDGQECGSVVVEGGAATGVQFGSALYRLH